jgi:hypothetical protein
VKDRQIRALIGPDFARWHEKWAEPKHEGAPRRMTRAKHCMDLVRRVIAYGVTLGFDDCIRADLILGKMRFEAPRPRTSKMTVEQLEAICRQAHAMGLGSIALATTLQFELALRQKDVIGEWEPCGKAAGGIVYNGTRWTGGLTWSDIGTDMILRKSAVKTGIPVEHDLRLYPTILEELALCTRRVGPMIISEATSEPYKHRTFTQTFRRVADAAGVPRGVWNMDARAGAISEATTLARGRRIS